MYGGEKQVKTQCHYCGKELLPSSRNTHRFCSSICRVAWWAKHPEKRLLIRKAICAYCGTEFEHDSRKNRKFCCRKCYGQSKIGKKADTGNAAQVAVLLCELQEIPATRRIFMVCGNTHFNGKYDSFVAQLPDVFEGNLLNGDIFAFSNQTRRQVS